MHSGKNPAARVRYQARPPSVRSIGRAFPVCGCGGKEESAVNREPKVDFGFCTNFAFKVQQLTELLHSSAVYVTASTRVFATHMSADVERVAEAPAELEEIIGVDGLTDGLTAYERDRQERIKRNHAALDALGVRQAAMAVNLVVETGNVARKKATKRKEKLPKEETVAPMPAKRSRRVIVAPMHHRLSFRF